MTAVKTCSSERMLSSSLDRIFNNCVTGKSKNSSLSMTSWKLWWVKMSAMRNSSRQEWVSAKALIPRQFEGSSWRFKNSQHISWISEIWSKQAAGRRAWTLPSSTIISALYAKSTRSSIAVSSTSWIVTSFFRLSAISPVNMALKYGLHAAKITRWAKRVLLPALITTSHNSLHCRRESNVSRSCLGWRSEICLILGLLNWEDFNGLPAKNGNPISMAAVLSVFSIETDHRRLQCRVQVLALRFNTPEWMNLTNLSTHF